MLRFMVRLLASSTQRRHTLRWIASQRADYLLRNKRPWLTFDATELLAALNLRGKRVFEYGSGGSTLFWLSRGAICVSIEHDKAWYNQLLPLTPVSSQFDYRLVEPEPYGDGDVLTWDPSDPGAYITGGDRENKVHYRSYVSQIDMFPDNYFDIVLVDGRARPSCIKHSVSKIKHGGLLILDNSERAYYTRQTSQFLKNFTCRAFPGASPMNQAYNTTSIYTKQC